MPFSVAGRTEQTDRGPSKTVGYSMGPDLSHVTAFTEHIGSGQSRPRSFYALDPPGEHYYLFRPTQAAFETVARMIAGEGLKRRLGGITLRACGVAPMFARLVPLISTRTVDIAFAFDVAVLSNRTRLVDLDERVVYTLSPDAQPKVVSEIEARTALPSEISTPELYEYDVDYPYFSEQFVDGWHPNSPVAGWDQLHQALDQLTYLYRADQERVEVTSLLQEIRTALDERGLRDEQPFCRALDHLEELRLPDAVYRSTIHGDFHTRNVLVEDDEVYIVDWESCGPGYVFCDFFRPFCVTHYDTRDPTTVVQLSTGEGRGGEIVREYISSSGKYALPDPDLYSGLPVLYLLLELSRTRRSPLWASYRELLNDTLDGLDLESQSPSRTSR